MLASVIKAGWYVLALFQSYFDHALTAVVTDNATGGLCLSLGIKIIEASQLHVLEIINNEM